jgi:hypothetical protein
MNLAPIGIITYSRIEHLKKTIESLKNNTLAGESELFLFIDGPKKGDEEKVNVIRKYAEAINGFKKVCIKSRSANSREENYFEGIGGLLARYKKVIFLEDDNVVSSKFLEYMNDGLEFYKYDKSIMAISGYNVSVEFPDSYKYDYYKSTYFNTWGFATWLDRSTLDIEQANDQYSEMLKDKELYKKIKEKHPRLISGLKKIHEGTLNAGDYKLAFHLIKNDLYTIKPIKSFVNNIGHDGSGAHCGINNRFENTELNESQIKFEDVDYNKLIDSIYYKHVTKREAILQKIIRKLFG